MSIFGLGKISSKTEEVKYPKGILPPGYQEYIIDDKKFIASKLSKDFPIYRTEIGTIIYVARRPYYPDVEPGSAITAWYRHEVYVFKDGKEFLKKYKWDISSSLYQTLDMFTPSYTEVIK